jgi:ribosomal protein L12E/L44/L45/RPP1/RPP2
LIPKLAKTAVVEPIKKATVNAKPSPTKEEGEYDDEDDEDDEDEEDDDDRSASYNPYSDSER